MCKFRHFFRGKSKAFPRKGIPIIIYRRASVRITQLSYQVFSYYFFGLWSFRAFILGYHGYVVAFSASSLSERGQAPHYHQASGRGGAARDNLGTTAPKIALFTAN